MLAHVMGEWTPDNDDLLIGTIKCTRPDLVTDDEGEDDDEVAVYCPECWEREFAE